MENESKIRVDHLTKKFGDLLVLDDISFEVKQGEFVCVVGPTGCGKTTFLNLLTRIYQPSSGELYIDGIPADPKKHNISFAFQEPSAMPWLTVSQNLEFGMWTWHWRLPIMSKTPFWQTAQQLCFHRLI